MILSHALQPVSNNASFLSVDVTRVEEKAGELLTEIAASSKPDPTLKTHEPQEKPKKRKSITLATRPIGKGLLHLFFLFFIMNFFNYC